MCSHGYTRTVYNILLKSEEADQNKRNKNMKLTNIKIL